MPTYQITAEEKEILGELREFRKLLDRWWKGKTNAERLQVRPDINRHLHRAREIVQLAGCHQMFTIGPPPAVGGMILSGVDPFDRIFEDVYGHYLVNNVFDMIDQAIGVIESGQYQQRASRLGKTKGPLGPISGSKVFLVHGHDESAREGTARYLEKLHLEPIILHEQPNAGQTIIEKVEKYGGVAFAVVLLTPDDIGATRDKAGDLKPRARQNVILELGYFLARLGRKHVAALVKGDVEKPSDYDGVVYIQLDDAGAWKLELARELKTAGLDVDLNDAI
jgi:predicted nucleotide-binding protein